MNTEASHPQNPEHPKPHSSPAPSPLRLVILLSILVVVGGALIYDWVIAPPRVKAAYDKLQEEAIKHNEFGIKPDLKEKEVKDGAVSAESRTGGMLYQEDVRRILGMVPTKVEKTNLYTIEHYCWWGWIPRNRNYITVLYIGNPDRPHYSTHIANEMPEDESIPGKVKYEPQVGEIADAGKGPAGPPVAGPPGMGPPAGGAKGKGRPKGKNGDQKGSEQQETDGREKKGDNPTTADEPQKDSAGKVEKNEDDNKSEKDIK